LKYGSMRSKDNRCFADKKPIGKGGDYVIVQEIYLVKLKADSSQEDFMRVVSFLKGNNAQIITASMQRFWILGTLNQSLAEVVRKMAVVEMIGGVTFRKREIKVIRIKKS